VGRTVAPTAPNDSSKSKAQQGKIPAWWVFTYKSVAFAQAAKVLSSSIEDVYGKDISISHFERMIGELPTIAEDRRRLIHLDSDVLSAYDKYVVARDERDAERQSFRSFRSIQTVATGLETARQIVAAASDGQNDQEEKKD
jgi:hypothetical protein